MVVQILPTRVQCVFATVVDGIVLSRKVESNFKDGEVLCGLLDGMFVNATCSCDLSSLPGFEEYSVSVRFTTKHRCVIRVRGPSLTDSISNTVGTL